MCRVYRHTDTKKPATLQGRGLGMSVETGQSPVTAVVMLQLHSIFVRSWLLLGQAMDIATAQ